VETAEALLRYKRVFVKASHSVGKSFLAGGLVNWFFDCFNPGICVTTAPNAPQVRDILWKEVRMQRPHDLKAVLQPKSPRMESSPEHFAVGYTSRDGSAFQGRHEENMLIVFDECVGVAGEVWEAAEGMMTGDNCYFLAMCNPTDTGTRAYIECQNVEKWHVMEISALEHPNIAAEIAGQKIPFPKAVTLGWVEGRIKEWCTMVRAVGSRQSAVGQIQPSSIQESDPSPGQVSGSGDQGLGEKQPPSVPPQAGGSDGPPSESDPSRALPASGEGEIARVGDIEFPVGSGRWFRPGPLFESRVLGRWPTAGSNSVWSEAIWAAALVRQEVDAGLDFMIGCDVARFGSDFTSIVVRQGNCVLLHETHNGWSTTQTAGRIKDLATDFIKKGPMAKGSTRYWVDPLYSWERAEYNSMDYEDKMRWYGPGMEPPPTMESFVDINVDDDGVGGGVVDQGGSWRFNAERGGASPNSKDGYPNRRSELWFDVADRAAKGGLDLSRLSKESLALIQRQVMAPTWKLDAMGRRVVEAKAETKKRIGRSPDDADALNLAFAESPWGKGITWTFKTR